MIYGAAIISSSRQEIVNKYIFEEEQEQEQKKIPACKNFRIFQNKNFSHNTFFVCFWFGFARHKSSPINFILNAVDLFSVCILMGNKRQRKKNVFLTHNGRCTSEMNISKGRFLFCILSIWGFLSERRTKNG